GRGYSLGVMARTSQSDFTSLRLSSIVFDPLLMAAIVSSLNFLPSAGSLSAHVFLIAMSPEPSFQVNHFGSLGASNLPPSAFTFHHSAMIQLICGSHFTMAEATIDFGAKDDMST